MFLVENPMIHEVVALGPETTVGETPGLGRWKRDGRFPVVEALEAVGCRVHGAPRP